MPYKDPAKRRENNTAYMAKWREKNGARVLKQERDRRAENPEPFRAASRRHYKKHKEAILTKAAAYWKKNPEKRKAYSEKYNRSAEHVAAKRERDALQIKAMPRWADKTAILKVYHDARAMTEHTGIPHHVDHIWPLKGKGFNGLHVPWNLQVLTATDNLKKGNRLPCGA